MHFKNIISIIFWFIDRVTGISEDMTMSNYRTVFGFDTFSNILYRR